MHTQLYKSLSSFVVFIFLQKQQATKQGLFSPAEIAELAAISWQN